MKQTLVSIIIVNFNGKPWLQGCLNSLLEQDYINIEIVLVDNGSSDGSIEFVANNYPGVKIVREKQNFGYAQGSNDGVKQACGELLLFLNNDTVVESDFLPKLVQKMSEDSSIGACQPKIKILNDKNRLDSVGAFPTRLGFFSYFGFREVDQGQYDHIEEIFFAKGACFLMKRSLFERLGGFEEDFFCYCEDIDLSWKIWLAGYRIILIPQSVVYHKIGATTEKMDFFLIQYHSNKNRINCFLKNMSWKTLAWILPVHLSLYLFSILVMMMTFRFRNAQILLKAVGWNVIHLRQTLEKRKQIQKHIRTVSDKKVVISKMAPIPWKILFREFYRFFKSKHNLKKSLGSKVNSE